MKSKMFLLIFLFLIFAPFANAQNITTGNASAQSTVETKIEGTGNFKTRIEIQANDKKEVLEASNPGTYKLEVKSDESTSTQVSTPNPVLKEEKPDNFAKRIQIFVNKIFSFITNIFSFR